MRGCFLLDVGQRCEEIHPGHRGYSNNINTITAVKLDNYFHINCLHFPFIKTSVTTITTLSAIILLLLSLIAFKLPTYSQCFKSRKAITQLPPKISQPVSTAMGQTVVTSAVSHRPGNHRQALSAFWIISQVT